MAYPELSCRVWQVGNIKLIIGCQVNLPSRQSWFCHLAIEEPLQGNSEGDQAYLCDNYAWVSICACLQPHNKITSYQIWIGRMSDKSSPPDSEWPCFRFDLAGRRINTSLSGQLWPDMVVSINPTNPTRTVSDTCSDFKSRTAGLNSEFSRSLQISLNNNDNN